MNRTGAKLKLLGFLGGFGLLMAAPIFVGAQLSPEAAEEQAFRLYQRINGQPPKLETLEAMRDDFLAGQVDRATFRAMNSPSLGFYRSTLKSMFNALSNPQRDETLPLNDFSATVVGIVRDNLPFNKILYGDIMYTGDDESMDFYTFRALPNNISRTYCGVNTNPADCVDIETITFEDGIFTIPNHGLIDGQRFRFLRVATQENFLGANNIAEVVNDNQIRMASNERGYFIGDFRSTLTISQQDVVDDEGVILLIHEFASLEPASKASRNPSLPLVRDNQSQNNINFAPGSPNNNFLNLQYRAFDEEGELVDFREDPKTIPLLNPAGAASRYQDNHHYQLIEWFMPQIWPSRLQRRTQTEVYAQVSTTERVSEADIMGLVTLREMAQHNFTAGTNRAAFQNIMSSFFCKNMSQVADSSAPDNRVRRDIARSPFSEYQNSCRGCHAGMDAMSGAFAYFDFDANNEYLNYSPSALVGAPNDNDNSGVSGPRKQYRAHTTYPPGHLPTDNSWQNPWTAGPNIVLGWNLPSSGQSLQSGVGARALGEVLAHTDAFGECMTRRSFERICGRPPTANELKELKEVSTDFRLGMPEYASEEADGVYNFKALFARITPMCWGRLP